MIDREFLMQEIEYDKLTGEFRRNRTVNGNPKGKKLGWVAKNGYVYISFCGTQHLAHRLAWTYVYSEAPPNDIDHINGIRTDNRIDNLRKATRSENLQNATKRSNNKSGYVGVSYYAATNKWQACIQVNGEGKHLGYFETKELAAEAYLEAKRKVHAFSPEVRGSSLL